MSAAPGPAVEALAARSLLGARLPCLLIVRTGSMRPLLPVGATVEVRPCSASELASGQVACIDQGDGPLLLHRYVGTFERGGRRWHLTRGDRCGGLDPPVASSRLLGRVEVVHWHGLRLSLGRPTGRAAEVALALAWRLGSWVRGGAGGRPAPGARRPGRSCPGIASGPRP